MPQQNWYDQRILDKIYKLRIIDENGCWLHYNWKNGDRPQIHYRNKLWRLSRLILKLTTDFDSKLQANHRCNNKGCFNPEHLYLGTQNQNIDDYKGKTTCEKGHFYKRRKDGYKTCLICQREYQREYNKKHRL